MEAAGADRLLLHQRFNLRRGPTTRTAAEPPERSGGFVLGSVATIRLTLSDNFRD